MQWIKFTSDVGQIETVPLLYTPDRSRTPLEEQEAKANRTPRLDTAIFVGALFAGSVALLRAKK